ncbi:MAG: transporter substrate-binding domain-containing protein [Streptomycetaceae bacterium]|nr:transporter substrate-binding domain-containing protein [Streptomycetaceae bacterium]
MAHLRSTRAFAAVAAAGAMALLMGACAEPDSADTGGAPAAAAGTALPTPAFDQALFDKLPQSIRDSKVITLAGDQHAPYLSIVAGGKQQGIIPDLNQALSAVLGVRFDQQVVTGLPAILTGIQSDRYDLSLGPINDTRDREQTVDIVTWLTSFPAFTVREDAKITDFAGLCGRSLALVQGSTMIKVADALSAKCAAAGQAAPQVSTFADENAAQLALNSGRADAHGATIDVAKHYAEVDSGKVKVVTDTGNYLGRPKDYLGALVNKNRAGLTEAIQGALQKIFADGTYDAIVAKWGLQDTRVGQPELNRAGKAAA